MLNRVTRGYRDQVSIFKIHDEKIGGNVRAALNRLEKELKSDPAQKVVFDFKNVKSFSQGSINFLQQLILYFQIQNIPVGVSGMNHLPYEQVDSLVRHCKQFSSLQDAVAALGVVASGTQHSISSKKQFGFFSHQTKQLSSSLLLNSKSYQKTSSGSVNKQREKNNVSQNKPKIKKRRFVFSNFKNTVHCFLMLFLRIINDSFNDSVRMFRIGGVLLFFGIVIWAGLLREWYLGSQLENAIKEGDIIKVTEILKTRDVGKIHLPHNQSPLILALTFQQIPIAKLLLRQPIEIDARDPYGRTALMFAAYKGHKKIVETILNKGADANLKTNSGETAMTWALKERHFPIIKLLLKNGSVIHPKNPNWSRMLVPLEVKDQLELRQLLSQSLVQKGISITKLNQAISNNQIGEVRRLIKAGVELNPSISFHEAPLMNAIRKGEMQILSLLISEGVKVNFENSVGETPLTLAAYKNDTEAVRLLVEADADVNLGKVPALMWISFHGDVKTIRLLLEHGARVNAANPEGWTPLMWAVNQGHAETVWHLVSAGANINAHNQMGFSPLMFAVRKGHSQLARLLIAKGAIIAAKNLKGKSALDFAVEVGNLELIQLLQQTEWLSHTSSH